MGPIGPTKGDVIVLAGAVLLAGVLLGVGITWAVGWLATHVSIVLR